MDSFTIQDALHEHLSGNFKKAQGMYDAIIGRYPTAFVPYFYMASLYAQQDRLVDSMVYLHRALQMEPQAAAYNNLGTLYRRLNHTDLAEEALKKGLELESDMADDINNNLGTLYINEGNPGEGEPYLREAIKINPEHQEAHWNLGLLLLEDRQWVEGWKNYHWGVQSPDRMNRWSTWPQWQKERDTVLIYGEQGLGDEIMFSSIMPDALRDAEKVIYECHPRLEETFKRTFPTADIYPTRKQSICEVPGFKYRCAVGDLGMLYRNNDSAFPKNPYLVLDGEKLEAVKQGYERYPKPWIGIGWKGGKARTRRELRSLPLEEWLPILEATNGTFFSFQYDLHTDQEVDVFCKAHPSIRLYHFPSIARSDNYDVILHHLYSMDCVLHVNGSGVHACGALGQPCVTLTPSRPAWRYAISGKDMPFYGENVTQIRQLGDDWQSLISEAEEIVRTESFPKRLNCELV